MKRQELKNDFDWQWWRSQESDLKKMEPLLASRILFDIFLINEFEHAVLSLKKDDCV